MKRISLGAVYEAGLLAILFLIVVHAPLSVWFGTIFTEQQIAIKAWKEISLAALAVVGVALAIKHRRSREVMRSPLVWLGGGYVVWHLVLALALGGEATSVIAGLMIDLRFIVMAALMYVLILVRPQALKRVFAVAAAGATVVISFGLLQITVLPDDILSEIGYSKDSTIAPYMTIDSNTDYVRINSTTRGPNPLGAVLVIYISLAAAYLLHRFRKVDVRQRVSLVVGSLAGVAVLFASYSRSAYGALVAALGILLVLKYQLTKKLIISGALVALVGVASLFAVAQTDWFSNVILHEDPESTVVTKSNDEHVRSLRVGWERMMSEPFGHGVGSTGSASLRDTDTTNDMIIENYYFFVAHEAGWLGLVLFFAVFGYVMVQLWRVRNVWYAAALFVSGFGLALIGVLLPVWADETVALIWWGMSGAVLAATKGIIKDNDAIKRKSK